MYSKNKEKEIKVNTLIKRLTDKGTQLVGMSYSSDEFPNGILCEPYIDSIQSEDGSLEFSSKVFMAENDKLNMKYFDGKLEHSGLGFVRIEQAIEEVKQSTGLITGLMLKDTTLSTTKKIDLVSTFINPTVTYQTIKLLDYTFTIYKIKETMNEFTHIVNLMVTERIYDGQTLLGMMEGKDFSKTQTLQMFRLLSGDKLINKEIAGAYIETADARFSLYNTHETGVFVVINDDKISIACGQSFINFDVASVVSSHLKRVSTDKYTLEVKLKNNRKLNIFI
ncbi:hypothetical protein LCFBJUUZ_CDS0170 [Staphylococcus phage PG-2021_76]|uniref:Uncharacterized protein n=1 Tax=Mammaliicoccus phage MSShimriz1 TaxID=3230127 RepID=A0AAU8GT83_9VIRU